MFTLEAEERCGHLVTEEAKKLWAAQLALLKEFQRICKKYDIKYYAIEGTLLGAVRHNGYIPWDDDIDVGVYCDDYDRFIKVVQDELPPYYEFQHYSTQDGINIGISRIRDSRTTSCTNYEYSVLAEDENYNCGIFLDIFPLFDIPESKVRHMFQIAKAIFANMAVYGYIDERRMKLERKTKPDGRFAKLCVPIWKFLSKKQSYQDLAQKRYDSLKMYKNSDKIGIVSGIFGNHEKFVWKKSWFVNTVELPFEDISIACPKEYHELLTHRYGDYNTFVKGTSIHTFAVVDADTPYKEKLKEHYIEMQKIFR